MKLIAAFLLISSCTFEKSDKVNITEEVKQWGNNKVVTDFKYYSDSVIRVRKEQDSLKWVIKGCF
jgi:hypothetical protein